jgi:phage-related baseplate assembly protein
MMATEFKNLPKPSVIEEIDAKTIVDEMVDWLKNWGKKNGHEFDLRDSDPALRLIEVFAYREMMLRQRVNSAALQCFLAFAQGSNLDHIATLFGVERAKDQSDTELRIRARENPDKLSTAGSSLGYRRHALDVDGRIADVGVSSFEPGRVTVTVLPRYEMEDPNDRQEILQKVQERLKGDDIRPIGDRVEVRLAELHVIELEIILFISRGSDKKSVLEEASGRLRSFLVASYRVEGVLSVSGLFAALHVSGGVDRVKLTGLEEDQTPSATQAVHVSSFRIWAHGDERPKDPQHVAPQEKKR